MMKFQLRGGMRCDTVIDTIQNSVSGPQAHPPTSGFIFYGGLREFKPIVISFNSLPCGNNFIHLTAVLQRLKAVVIPESLTSLRELPYLFEAALGQDR